MASQQTNKFAIEHASSDVIRDEKNRTVVTVCEFDLGKARIYGEELHHTGSHIWDNYSNETQNGTVDGRITTSRSYTFNKNVTVSGTVTTTFQTGLPFIASAGKIEVSPTASYSQEWGETITQEQHVGQNFTVVLPPKKRTVALGMYSKARCEVPFTYTQTDYPSGGGPPRVTTLHDGVFTGANAYGFKTEVRHEKLPTDHNGPAPTKCIKSIEAHKE